MGNHETAESVSGRGGIARKHGSELQPRGTMTVVELEAASDVPSHVIRYYARVGLLKPDRNPENGYKLFGPRHKSRLIFIRRAKSLGFSLKEIKEICRHADMGASPCPRVREIIEKRIGENHDKLESLVALQYRMEKALRKWKKMTDGLPTGESVCHLIESITEESR